MRRPPERTNTTSESRSRWADARARLIAWLCAALIVVPTIGWQHQIAHAAWSNDAGIVATAPADDSSLSTHDCRLFDAGTLAFALGCLEQAASAFPAGHPVWTPALTLAPGWPRILGFRSQAPPIRG